MIKKIFLISALFFSNFNLAKSEPVGVKKILDLTDVELAINVGDLNYLKNILDKNPNVAKELYQTEKNIYSNIKNYEIFQLLYKNDPDLLKKLNSQNKNLLMNKIFTYYEEINSKKLKGYINESEDITEKDFPTLNAKIKEIKKNKNDIEDYNFMVKKIIDLSDKNSINLLDNNKNTILNFAVYNRNYQIANLILSNNLFNKKMMINKHQENALFMLLSQNCNVPKEEENDIKIMKILLKNNISPISTNNQGNSFGSLVFGLEKFAYLRPALEDSLTPTKVNFLKKQADGVMLKFNKNEEYKKENYNFSDFFSAISRDNEYTEFTCEK